MADYAFVTRWYLPSPIEQVYACIEDAPGWPGWWKGVRAVSVVAQGDAAGIGQVTRTTWRSLLPYDLTFDARLVKRDAPRLLEVVAFGELEGLGRWELRPDGGGTEVTYHWRVATTRWWMNALAPIARPLFRWNHDTIMRWGGLGLARRLGVDLVER